LDRTALTMAMAIEEDNGVLTEAQPISTARMKKLATLATLIDNKVVSVSSDLDSEGLFRYCSF
jgi:hypothetical protein